MKMILIYLFIICFVILMYNLMPILYPDIKVIIKEIFDIVNEDINNFKHILIWYIKGEFCE